MLMAVFLIYFKVVFIYNIYLLFFHLHLCIISLNSFFADFGLLNDNLSRTCPKSYSKEHHSSYFSERRFNMKRHLLIHNDGKYHCSYCPYSTVRSFNLKRHLIIHIDGKKISM